MPTKRTLTRQLADLQRRYQTVVDERDDAREQVTSDRSVVQRLANQVTEARNERDAAIRKVDANRPKPSTELRDTRRALMLCERARRHLTEQIADLQAANEAMSNQLADAAPTWEAAR